MEHLEYELVAGWLTWKDNTEKQMARVEGQRLKVERKNTSNSRKV